MKLADQICTSTDADAILTRFLDWVASRDLELYPAQQEAILEVMAGRHVILNTPTGSGKSLVALAMHFKALCEGKRSFYTAPIKALASEKFFAWCDELGAENVGMLTGDASINRDAAIVCCTAEILQNYALREGRYAPVDYAVMDEFHYYADRDRGIAWQIPLLELADATFMLMSATLGEMGRIAGSIEQTTGREVAIVRSRDRPVPLDYSYRDMTLHRIMGDLAEEGRLPVYIVNFTQRDAGEQAQNLTSMNLCDKPHKQAIAAALGEFRFDTPYGKDMRRFLGHGIGLHHAGLLPKYRLLVERLAQQGLLKVISGTDTLGVGVNVPIRTVLFTKLYKYDGEQTRILSVRNFQQIAGRAGRRGFDDKGSVICMAPEHVVENKEADAKARAGGKKKKVQRKKPPPHYVAYNKATFNKLVASEPEELRSSFSLNHGILTNLLDRGVTAGHRDGGYRRLVGIIGHSHESERSRRQHRRHGAQLFRSLREAGVIELVSVDWDSRRHVRLTEGLQRQFSLHHALSLYLVEALHLLDPGSESYALDVLTLVEAILEDPRVILYRQVDKLKGDKVAEMKAQGIPYEERMAELEKITHPKPNADFIYDTFDAFRESHPWVRQDNVRPKSIARDMVERYASFREYDRDYGLQRSEGVLLRYLTQTYKALVQTVPDAYKTEPVVELVAYFRTMLEHVDSSLVREWESMRGAEGDTGELASPVAARLDITRDKRSFYARIRAELHRLVKALAARDYEEAARCVRLPDADSADPAWSPEHFVAVLEAYYAAYERILFDHRARLTELTLIEPAGHRIWSARQTLLDPDDERLWYVGATVDMSAPDAELGPLLRLERIGT